MCPTYRFLEAKMHGRYTYDSIWRGGWEGVLVKIAIHGNLSPPYDPSDLTPPPLPANQCCTLAGKSWSKNRKSLHKIQTNAGCAGIRRRDSSRTLILQRIQTDGYRDDGPLA